MAEFPEITKDEIEMYSPHMGADLTHVGEGSDPVETFVQTREPNRVRFETWIPSDWDWCENLRSDGLVSWVPDSTTMVYGQADVYL